MSLACLISALSQIGEASLHPAQIQPILLTQSTSQAPLAGGAEVVCDPNGNMTLEEAESAIYAALPPDMETSPGCNGYWLRFSVEAISSPAGDWLLKFPTPWRYIDLYAIESGGITVARSGISKPPQDRDLSSADLAVPLALTAGSPKLFYLHVAGDTSVYGESRFLAPSISRLEGWFLGQRSELFGEGIYAGIVAGLALYNLILFLTINERVYLYYVLYVVSFATVWIARTGFLFQHLWPNHVRWNQNYLPYVAAAAIVCSVLFVRDFLSTRKYLPRIDVALRVLVIITLLSCLAGLGGDSRVLALPLALIGLAVSVLYAGMGLYVLMRGFRPARFFMVAWAALVVGNLAYILMFLRVIPMTFFTYHSAQAGSAMECILLAFALADRVSLLKETQKVHQLQYTHELQKQIKQRTGELTDAVERLKTASVTDPLTGLSNRRHVDAAIQPWIADILRARVRNTPGEHRRSLAICLSDLDHFKLVNDELGHAIGDQVLQAVAETLRRNVRATAILARWGGEEFLILDHITGPYEDVLMAERLRQAMIQETSAVNISSGRNLSISLGLVRYPFSEVYPDLLTWDHCLVLADHALYRAKREGRNRWECYRANEAALRRAIRERGGEEVRRLLRLHTEEAFSLGLIEVIDQVPLGVEVG